MEQQCNSIRNKEFGKRVKRNLIKKDFLAKQKAISYLQK